jgi:two-component system cell cycle sensor histidine kinase/response regulator CckA
MDSPSRLRRLVVTPPTSHDFTDDQFRTFASRLAYIVWRLSPNGTRLLAPQWCIVTGKYEHELDRDAWLDTIHPEDRSRVNTEVRGAIIYKSHVECDLRLRHMDGSFHWYRMRGDPIHGAHDVLGWTGLLLKIDGEKAAELALSENEVRLHAIIDAARVGTLEHEIESGVIRLSEHALELIGLPMGANPVLNDVVRCIHPEDRATFLNAMMRASDPTSDGAFEVTFRVPRPGGRMTWVVSRGVYQFTGTGNARKAVRFVGACGDMTEQLRDLSERARLSSIVSSSQDAIIATSLDGLITHWNDAAERMFGYTAAEVMHTSVCRLTPADLKPQCLEQIAAVCRGDSVIARTTRRMRKDGVSLDVSLTFSLIRDGGGVGTGISAVIRDVTGQVRLETELAHAQKMEALGRLAGGVAHDLNNTLTAVLAGIDWATHGTEFSADARTAFSEIRTETFRASALVRDLLAVAQRQVISPSATSLNATIHDIAPMLARMLGEDISLDVHEGATRGAFVDDAQLKQVILNLAINARDAMPNGGTLAISTGDSSAGDRVVLTIRDTGCGMDADVQARIFDPFFSTKPAGLGTGLGLSTTYGVVAQSAGTISVESTVGVGTTFTISLPALPEPASAPKLVVVDAAPRPTSECILVVEDNAAVRCRLVDALRSEGFDVLAATCGANALEVVAQHASRIQFVVTDVVMPNMNGIELVALIRRSLLTVPAIFMSGYSEKAIANYGVMAPDTQLVQKPFEVADLAAKIRHRLSRRILLARPA